MCLNVDISKHLMLRTSLVSNDEGVRGKIICWTSVIALVVFLTVGVTGCKRDSKSRLQQAQNIHEAAASGDKDAVERFLAEGVSVNAPGEMWLTPLHLAARHGHTEVVELLIATGADLEATDKTGMTALHWAATYGSLHVVKTLVAKGANVNAKNKHGGTPLSAATMGQGECEEVALFLLANGSDPRVRHSDGSTILHKAVLNGQPDVLRILLEHGAEPAVKDKDGKTALDRARAISQAKFRRGSASAKKKPQFEMCVQILEQQSTK
jgi:ankyrin repeat protein